MNKTYITRIYRSLAGGLLALGLIVTNGATAGTIVGSQHDFSGSGWAGGEICVVCHAPHNTATVADAPLWNHELTTSTFDLYASPTFDGVATQAQPDGSSVLCLSCHDGTVAVDSFGGTTGSTVITGDALLGTDLSNDHPISFTYDAALATLDPGLHDPTATTVTIGGADKVKTGTIDDVMLFSDKLQCASCHDVHNGFTNDDKLLRISQTGSGLCIACHNK